MFNKILKGGKLFLLKIDVFSSSQLLRYKNQTSYSTLTGGTLSFLIIVIFGAILIQESTAVITKNSVNAQDFTYYVDNPTYTSFPFDNSTKFIIGVGISGLNLSSTQRYFDITMFTQVFSYGKLINKIYHDLQPCQYDQWAHINELGGSSFNSAGLNGFLCPSSNVTVELEGKYTSESFKLMVINIGKCNNSTDPQRPCVDDSVIRQKTTYTVNYYFMNPFVNSGTLEPVNYYLEDRNYFVFNTQSTVDCNVYLTQNFISTDNSLLPWEDPVNETVLLVRQLSQFKPATTTNSSYISIHLRKSPYFILSQRSFEKLSDLFSAIGGLFGFAITFFLVIQIYTQASFEIEMGDRLFYYSESRPLKSGSFNFIYFLFYCLYDFLKNFDIEIPWERLKVYYECRQEVTQQLDISLLMNKITFLEKCMTVLFQQHQYRAIYLRQKPTVKEAEMLRINHGINKILHKNSKKINDRIQDKVKKHSQKLKKQKKSTYKRKFSTNTDQKSKEQPSIEPSTEKQQKNSDYLMQFIANFLLKNTKQQGIEEANQGQKQIRQMEVISEQLEENQGIEIEEVAGENHGSIKFVNTALKDIEQIERQSKSGNILSQRIYDQLNNDITKEQLMIMKCLEFIVSQKEEEKGGEDRKNEGAKISIFQNLLKLTKPDAANESQKEAGLEIVLQSNNRIITDADL